jgi:hypothetical protein
MKHAELKKGAGTTIHDELNLASLKKLNWVLGISLVSIAIVFFTFCYTSWKDHRTNNPDDLFKDATAMKEFILNQMVQAH